MQGPRVNIDRQLPFLVIELWAGSDEDARPSKTGIPQHPGFRVITPRHSSDSPSVTHLVRELELAALADSFDLLLAVTPTNTAATARDLLEVLPKHCARGIGNVRSAEVAARAEVELAHYRQANPDVGARVELHEELTSLMVSGGNRLVGKNMSFPANRCSRSSNTIMAAVGRRYRQPRRCVDGLLGGQIVDYDTILIDPPYPSRGG